jgi:putative peptidoglycan lipid II flippase
VLAQQKVSELIHPYATARSAAGLAALSLLSPIAGTAVEMAVARRFGTSGVVDGFRIALAIVYVGQQLFVVSVFPNVIVPLFEQYRTEGYEAEAWRSSIRLANLALVPTLIASLILFASPRTAVWILAPGLAAPALKWAVFFVRWFGLSLIPLLYSGVAIGLLYVRRIFWTATAAQLLSNLLLFASVLMLGGAILGPASIALGMQLATVAFLLVQLLKLKPVLNSARIRPHAERDVVSAAVRKGISLGVPMLGLPLMNQGTAIVAVWSLSAASVGTIAELGYAGKLMRMASLLPDVMATVLFPKFAMLARRGDRCDLGELTTHAMRMALFIGVPIACTLFALRLPLVELLFRHGAFSDVAAQRVGLLFGFFLTGMPAGIVSFYQLRIFYALEDTWWPACATFLSVLCAALIMPPAAGKFGAGGVAVSFALIGWMNALIQGYVLRFKYAACHGRALAFFALKIVGPSASAAWLGSAAAQVIGALSPSGTLELMVEFGSGAIVAFLVYWLTVMVAGMPEALEISRYIRWQTAPALNSLKAVICG